MKRVIISLTRPINICPFEVTRLAIQKLLVRTTTSHVHGSSSTATCFIVASISIVPISLLSLSLSCGEPISQGLYLLHMDSNLSIALNLLRSGNKSAGREDNVDVAGASVDVGATVANVGTTGVGDLHLLRDGLTDGGGKEYDDTLHLLRGGDVATDDE
ncbi:hypothetical protein Tco_0145975 [Tanacetum coccineum]